MLKIASGHRSFTKIEAQSLGVTSVNVALILHRDHHRRNLEVDPCLTPMRRRTSWLYLPTTPIQQALGF
jgi:hypothetical protein